MKSANINLLTWNIFKSIKIDTGITTRQGGFSKPPYSSFNLAAHTGDDINTVIKNRALLSEKLNCEPQKYTHGNQVHGDHIHLVDINNIGVNNIDCDALITKETDVILNIFVADCVPVIIYDPIKKVGGICHCGWKGTYKSLLSKTVTRLRDLYGSKTENILVGIGPSIGSCCYNVSQDLYEKFSPKKNEGKTRDNKFYLDLKMINKNQAIESGIGKKNIEVMDMCTSCMNDKFFSYRKEGEPSGRFSCFLKIIS